MNITNNTRLSFVTAKLETGFYLITQAVYQVTPGNPLDLSSTYDLVFTETIENIDPRTQTLVQIHGLNNKSIDKYSLEDLERRYEPSNKRTCFYYHYPRNRPC